MVLSLVPAVVRAQNYPPSVAQKVQSAQKEVRTIGVMEFRKVVDHPGDALIIDVREPDEYATGHIPGTINIPRGLLEFQIWKQVGFPVKTDMSKQVYLQCSSGNRASLSAKSLHELGFTNVTAVVMTLDDWQKADNPFVK
jgi:rhodanese-related sulfurtransferase